MVSIVPTTLDPATSPRARVSLPPRIASAGPGLRSGVVNCAAYEGGVRIADVEVGDVRQVLTSSTCTTSPSRTPTTRTSDRSSRSTTTRCSSSCARRR